mgnify:CR=1 FL=1
MKNLAHQLPLIALIGPTNAGKSTLFNRLTGTRAAVTAKESATTRDRIYGLIEWQGRHFNIVDSGGLAAEKSDLQAAIDEQTVQAIKEAKLILYIIDGRLGWTATDSQFVNRLRATKTVWLVINKVDTPQLELDCASPDYLDLPTWKIAAATGRAVGDLLTAISEFFPGPETRPAADLTDKTGELVVAIVGRPNVGKSSLLNALTKSQRAVVAPTAGTTRDVVTSQLEIESRRFLLADTAGVRRRGRIVPGVEKFSVSRTLEAINAAGAVIVLVDATDGSTRGDLHLIYYASDQKKPVLVVFNKIDLVLERQLVPFHHHLARFPQVQISALTGKNIPKILEWLASLSTEKRVITRPRTSR